MEMEEHTQSFLKSLIKEHALNHYEDSDYGLGNLS